MRAWWNTAVGFLLFVKYNHNSIKYYLQLYFYNSRTVATEQVSQSLDNQRSTLDCLTLIIGRDSIRKYELFSYVPLQISCTGLNRTEETLSVQRTTQLCGSCTCSENLLPSGHPLGMTVLPVLITDLDVYVTLVDHLDPLVDVPSTSYEDTHGTGAFEHFLTHPLDKSDILSPLG